MRWHNGVPLRYDNMSTQQCVVPFPPSPWPRSTRQPHSCSSCCPCSHPILIQCATMTPTRRRIDTMTVEPSTDKRHTFCRGSMYWHAVESSCRVTVGALAGSSRFALRWVKQGERGGEKRAHLVTFDNVIASSSVVVLLATRHIVVSSRRGGIHWRRVVYPYLPYPRFTRVIAYFAVRVCHVGVVCLSPIPLGDADSETILAVRSSIVTRSRKI